MLLTEDRLPSRQERLPIRQCACVMNGWIRHPEARFVRNFINLPTDRCRGEHVVITENPASSAPRLPGAITSLHAGIFPVGSPDIAAACHLRPLTPDFRPEWTFRVTPPVRNLISTNASICS